jgi:uncharacterized membrane protein YbhN (UPF0104 family)
MSERARYLLKLAFTGSALALLFYWQGARLKDLPSAWQKAHVLAVAASALLNILATIVLPALITRLTILDRERPDLSLAELVRINFILRFYSLVLPNGATLALRWQRYRRGGGSGEAFALVVFEKLVMFFVYVLGAAVFLALDLRRVGPHGGITLAAVSLLAVGWTGLLFPFFLPGLARPTQALASRVGRMLPRLLRKRVQVVCDSVIDFHRLPQRRVGYIWIVSFTSYVLFVLSAFVLERGMGLGLGLLAIAWMRPLVFVLTLIPLTVAGLGVREVSYVTFMGFYGIDSTTALGFGLLLFGIQVGMGLIGAALELAQRRSEPEPAR